jgi:hypothetical protein
LIVDDTIKEIIEEVRVLVKTKYKKDLTSEQVFKIVKTQVDVTIVSIAKNISVHWKGMGKFLFNGTMKRDKEIYELDEKLKSLDYDLTPQEKVEIKRNLILEKAKERDINLSKQRHAKALTAKEVLDSPDAQRIALKSFKALK